MALKFENHLRKFVWRKRPTETKINLKTLITGYLQSTKQEHWSNCVDSPAIPNLFWTHML